MLTFETQGKNKAARRGRLAEADFYLSRDLRLSRSFTQPHNSVGRARESASSEIQESIVSIGHIVDSKQLHPITLSIREIRVFDLLW